MACPSVTTGTTAAGFILGFNERKDTSVRDFHWSLANFLVINVQSYFSSEKTPACMTRLTPRSSQTCTRNVTGNIANLARAEISSELYFSLYAGAERLPLPMRRHQGGPAGDSRDFRPGTSPSRALASPSPKKMSSAAPEPSLGAAAMLGALSLSAGCEARARSARSSGSSCSSASSCARESSGLPASSAGSTSLRGQSIAWRGG